MRAPQYFLIEVIHANGRDLVDRDEHRLTALPFRRKMFGKILGYKIKAFGGGDDVIVTLQLAFQPLGNIDILDFELFQLLGDPFVQIVDRDAELIAARIIIERHRRPVLNRALEIVAGDIISENALGDFVVGRAVSP